MGQDHAPGGVSVLCWLAAPVAKVCGNLPELGNNVKNGNKVQFATRSRFSEMSDQWRVSLYMIMSQNAM